MSMAVCVWDGVGNQISDNESVRRYRDLLADSWAEGRRTMCPVAAGSALVMPVACSVPLPKGWPPLGWETQLSAALSAGQSGFGRCMVHPAIERRSYKGEVRVYISAYIYIYI